MSLVGLILIPPIFAQVLRNDFDGSAGYRFKCARDMTIVALGRFAGSLFVQNHVVTLWTDAGAVLSAVTVTPSSPTDVDGYRFELSAPVTLISGQFYRVASVEFLGGDTWLNTSESSADPTPPNTSSSDFDPTVWQSAFGFAPGFFPVGFGSPNLVFGKHQMYEDIVDVVGGPRYRGGGKVRRPGRRR